jgi:hypothetical protein
MNSPIKTTIPIEIREPASSDAIVAPKPGEGGSTNCILDFISSDATLDRYCESIAPSGWQLDNYKRNPVFQNSHQYGDILFTLGRAAITEVRSINGSPALFQQIEFACDVNPMAKIAYGLYKGKFLNAVSVGFVPIRWDSPKQGKDGVLAVLSRRFLEQELLEVSAVATGQTPLPSDIEQSVIEQAAAWYLRKDQVGLEIRWDKGGAYLRISQLPLLPQVQAVIQKYTRLSL